MTIKHTRFGVTLELNANDSDTPAMVYYKSGSATYGFAIDTGFVCGNEDIDLPAKAIEWLATFDDKVEEIYNLARG